MISLVTQLSSIAQRVDAMSTGEESNQELESEVGANLEAPPAADEGKVALSAREQQAQLLSDLLKEYGALMNGIVSNLKV